MTMYSADRRYPFFWIGLESLFRSNDTNEVSYKLCQRIALFLADNPQDARALFQKAKTCYNTRSKIIHGRWENDPKIEVVMADTEAIVRTTFRRLFRRSANPNDLHFEKERHLPGRLGVLALHRPTRISHLGNGTF